MNKASAETMAVRVRELIETGKSKGVLTIVFPYSAVYRLQQSGCIAESEKRNAPDGRRRQYLRITETGRAYLKQLTEVYRRFSSGVASVLTEGEENHD